jgi:hypothetical protein
MKRSERSDPSNGYEGVASELMRQRNPSVGVATVRAWARSLPRGASIATAVRFFTRQCRAGRRPRFDVLCVLTPP